MTVLTNRLLQSVTPKASPYFIRDTKLTGFGAKINPSGSVKWIAEVRSNGRTIRMTLGTYPIMGDKEARTLALRYISDVHLGRRKKGKQPHNTLGQIFETYCQCGRLKESTLRNHRQVVSFYLQDWLKKPVVSITRSMVEERFYRIRDKGIDGGKPTYSQATKTMRILSALMNYAIGDEIIENNPVDVLKLKKIDRSIRKRDVYLPTHKVRELLEVTEGDNHPVTLAVHMMLYTGLRKNEALRLKWDDIRPIEGILCLLVSDTKNHRPHYVPVTERLQEVLERASNATPFLFPSTQKKGAPMEDVRPTLRRLSKLIGYDFKCHDLRRTFATRASEVGIDYLMVKRLLNHKSNDITGQYIQWNSKENLMTLRKALEAVEYR